MKITKLTRAEKNPDVYYAGFEDGSSLRVNIALIADYSLYTGRELDEDEYEALKASAKDASAKARALRILGKRNMSRREITERLMQKGESRETAEAAADWPSRSRRQRRGIRLVRHYNPATEGCACGTSCTGAVSTESCGRRRWPNCRKRTTGLIGCLRVGSKGKRRTRRHSDAPRTHCTAAASHGTR